MSFDYTSFLVSGILVDRENFENALLSNNSPDVDYDFDFRESHSGILKDKVVLYFDESNIKKIILSTEEPQEVSCKIDVKELHEKEKSSVEKWLDYIGYKGQRAWGSYILLSKDYGEAMRSEYAVVHIDFKNKVL